MRFTLDGWQLAGLVVGVLLPALVGLVTSRETNPSLKSLMLVALSAISGFGSELLQAHANNAMYDVGQGLLTALGAFVLGVATHFGVLIPTGAKDKLQAIGNPNDMGYGLLHLIVLVAAVLCAVLALVAILHGAVVTFVIFLVATVALLYVLRRNGSLTTV